MSFSSILLYCGMLLLPVTIHYNRKLKTSNPLIGLSHLQVPSSAENILNQSGKTTANLKIKMGCVLWGGCEKQHHTTKTSPRTVFQKAKRIWNKTSLTLLPFYVAIAKRLFQNPSSLWFAWKVPLTSVCTLPLVPATLKNSYTEN